MSLEESDVNDEFSEYENIDNQTPAIQSVDKAEVEHQYFNNKDLPKDLQEEPYKPNWCCWVTDGLTCCYVSTACIVIAALESLLLIIFIQMHRAIQDSNDYIQSLHCTNDLYIVMKGLMIISGIQAFYALLASVVLGRNFIRRAHDKRAIRIFAIGEILLFLSDLIFRAWEVKEFYHVRGSSSCVESVKSQAHYWIMMCVQNGISIGVYSLIGFVLLYISTCSSVNRFCPIAKWSKRRIQKNWSRKKLCEYDLKEFKKDDESRVKNDEEKSGSYD